MNAILQNSKQISIYQQTPGGLLNDAREATNSEDRRELKTLFLEKVVLQAGSIMEDSKAKEAYIENSKRTFDYQMEIAPQTKCKTSLEKRLDYLGNVSGEGELLEQLCPQSTTTKSREES